MGKGMAVLRSPHRKHMQIALRGIAMSLYEASNIEEPCARRPHAGICEGDAGSPAILPQFPTTTTWKENTRHSTSVLPLRYSQELPYIEVLPENR